jgi:hypothetical protein
VYWSSSLSERRTLPGWPNYGQKFLEVIATVYPGYKVTGAAYGLADGAAVGAVFAWPYNRFAGVG